MTRAADPRGNGDPERTAAEPPRGLETEVLDRYAQGAETFEQALCCPTEGYESEYLANLPREIIDKDYGCGDPSKWARPGDTVVDLGSGAGKICYILAQKVGAEGRVIGVDFNDSMLQLARKYQDQLAATFGYRNTDFRKGRIQDLALDVERADQYLADHPVRTAEDWAAFEDECDRLRREATMIETGSVDLVVSNCVLNLVRTGEKHKLFDEIFRVLSRGGRAVISDIVCDEEPPDHVRHDPHLWSGCIAGAFQEQQFLKMFEDAGFHGVEAVARQEEPWQVIEGVEFRSMTVRAYKGKQGPCWERNQAVVYRGPWKQVTDDDGHTYHRGRRMAVCDKTYKLLTDPDGPYAEQVIGIEPRHTVPMEEATPFDCRPNAVRPARTTKGQGYEDTRLTDGSPCDDGDCC